MRVNFLKKKQYLCGVLLMLLLPLSGCATNQKPAADASASASASEEMQQADLSHSAILGNSYVDGFVTYNVLPDTDCFYRIGLNVRTAFTKPMLNRDIPVIEELNNGKTYDRIFLIFGENELGWPNTKAFCDGYGDVIDTVRTYQPDAVIYIQSILPVSAEVSAANIDNTNNEQIIKFNDMLKTIAKDKDAVYLDVASIMTDADGNLPEDAATDGIHPGSKYYNKWADYLKTHAILEK